MSWMNTQMMNLKLWRCKMEYFTLLDLSNRLWYTQPLTIKQEGKEDILIENWELRSDVYRDIKIKWVRSIGVNIDERLQILLI